MLIEPSYVSVHWWSCCQSRAGRDGVSRLAACTAGCNHRDGSIAARRSYGRLEVRIAKSMILVLRGIVNAAFALHLFTSPELEWTKGFLHLGYYAAVDGTLALILAVVMSAERERGPVLPAAVIAVDGVFRIALALTTWLGPGIPYFALTSLLFFATIAACATVAGVAWGFLALRGAHRKRPIPAGARWPLGLGSAASLFLGAALLFADPGHSRRVLLASYALTFGVALLAAGLCCRRGPLTPGGGDRTEAHEQAKGST